MNKSNLIKLFSILLIGVMIVMFSTQVLAATDNGFNELPLSGNNTNTNNTNRANTNNTNTNRANTNNTNNTANRSSVYNNTNLPQTGIEDSIPVALLVVVFGISAVYAYKKIGEYKDI